MMEGWWARVTLWWMGSVNGLFLTAGDQTIAADNDEKNGQGGRGPDPEWHLLHGRVWLGVVTTMWLDL